MWLVSRFKLWLAAFAVGVAALFIAYSRGVSYAKAKRDLRDLRAHKKTTERMQDAEADLGDDPAVLREWLRQRDPDQR